VAIACAAWHVQIPLILTEHISCLNLFHISIVLASEKDLVDSIDLNVAVKKWASQTNRKLKLKFN
jgi:hypothetical protein